MLGFPEPSCICDADGVADGVANHINWKEASGSSITRYISMCFTPTKLDNEKEWRRRKGRSIIIFTIDGRKLVWGGIGMVQPFALLGYGKVCLAPSF